MACNAHQITRATSSPHARGMDVGARGHVRGRRRRRGKTGPRDATLEENQTSELAHIGGSKDHRSAAVSGTCSHSQVPACSIVVHCSCNCADRPSLTPSALSSLPGRTCHSAMGPTDVANPKRVIVWPPVLLYPLYLPAIALLPRVVRDSCCRLPLLIPRPAPASVRATIVSER